MEHCILFLNLFIKKREKHFVFNKTVGLRDTWAKVESKE
jgi:hypothetical protein